VYNITGMASKNSKSKPNKGNGAGPSPSGVLTTLSPSQNGDETFVENGYNPDEEEKVYARSLLSKQQLIELKKDVGNNGYMTIEQVRDFFKLNVAKESQESRGELYVLDPEMMLLVDTRTNYRIFVSGDNVYTRQELMDNFPFKAFKTTPERVFVQQEVGVFPPKKYAVSKNKNEYIARDVGDPEEFIMIEDMVGKAVYKNYTLRRAPLRVVKTKVFLGREDWDDFKMMRRFVTSFQKFVAPQALGGPTTFEMATRALPYFFGGHLWKEKPPALRDAKGAELDRKQQELAEKERIQQALEQKARELKKKEEELKAREKSLYESLGIDPPQESEKQKPTQDGDDTPPDDAVPLF
jgi:hypothetical protein